MTSFKKLFILAVAVSLWGWLGLASFRHAPMLSAFTEQSYPAYPAAARSGQTLPSRLAHQPGLFSAQNEGPDQDSDGIADGHEDRNGDGNLTNDDTDGDQRADYLDEDDDNDHVPTRQEDPNGNGQPLDDDSDGDGLPNYLDPDDDADIAPTRQEDANQNGDPTDDDRDQDTIPDYLDPADAGPGPGDSDNDGLMLHDGVECPAQPCRDRDNDGRPDYMDGDDDEDGLPTVDETLDSHATEGDDDQDGVPNYLDPQEDVHSQAATLGDLIWLDVDRDGIQDHDETGSSTSPFIQGVPGVMITLYEATTTLPVMTTQSDGVGRYHFVNVLPGRYFLEFTAPLGYEITVANQGSDDSFDSDAAPVVTAATTIARSAIITVTPGIHNPTLDLGLYFREQQGAGIGGQVWHDDNQNGLQDSAESGVAGVMVTLFNQAATVVATMRSDSTGAYQFTNLLPGTYALAFTPAADYAVTTMMRGLSEIIPSELDPGVGRTPFTPLAAGEVDRSWRVGLSLSVAPAAIDGRAWYDLNRNGLQESGEGAIAGVTVNLLTSRRQWLAGTTTNDEGRYRFDGLATGNYLISVNTPAGYVISQRAQGPQGTGAIDSDIYPSSGRTDLIMLLSGGDPVTRDVALSIPNQDSVNALSPATLQGRVWEDQSRNGLQDGGEIGIKAAIIKLYSAQGELLHSTKSDEQGNYHFMNLIPGDYRLECIAVDGYKITLVDQGAMETTDSDIDPNTGRTPLFRLQSGTVSPRWDAGLYLQPTAIALAGFQASLQGDALHIQWTTTAEMNTLGYHLVASIDSTQAESSYMDSVYTDGDLDAVRLNQRLIMNQGANGGVYTIDLPYNPAYDPPLAQIQLWLIEVTEDGTQTQWGPIRVMQAMQFLPIIHR